VFAPNAKEVYENMGINPRDKVIIYSDALNLDKALGLKKQCDKIGFKGMYSCILHTVSNCWIDLSDVRHRYIPHERFLHPVEWRQREKQGVEHGH